MLYSILDLAPVTLGGTVRDSFRNSLELVRLAERCGYYRYWVAEHHSIPGVASAATSVVIGYLAGGTSRIRIGSGGIMLPNHAPLVIAEQFGTLEAMYPGRIDLGLGRAPGGDPLTMRALRRGLGSSGDTFPQDLQELMHYLDDPKPGQQLKAIPGQGSHVPIYLLGSSTFSAQLAAELGLPFAFASHFAPTYMSAALNLYRQQFQPSAVLQEPYVMIGVNVFAAETDEEATRLFSSLHQLFLNMIRGRLRELPPPVERLDWNGAEERHVKQMTRVSAVGGPDKLHQELRQIQKETGADEMIATAHIFDQQARLKSFEIAAGVFSKIQDELAAEPSDL